MKGIKLVPQALAAWGHFLKTVFLLSGHYYFLFLYEITIFLKMGFFDEIMVEFLAVLC